MPAPIRHNPSGRTDAHGAPPVRGMKRLRRARMALARRIAGPHAHVSTRPDGRERRVFFLRGAPRSGTNWAAALLNLHPKVICEGEFHLENFIEVAQRHVAAEHHATSHEPARAELLAGVEDLVERTIRAGLALSPGAEWVGDRTPRPVRELIAGAPIIWMCRDGRDVLVSWMYHLLRTNAPKIGGAERMKGAFGDDYDAYKRDPSHFNVYPEHLLGDETLVRELSRTWGEHIRNDLDALDRIGRDAPTLKVRYEDLLADTEARRTRMYELLGLDPGEARPIGRRDRTAPGFDEKPGSFYRKGEAGDWKHYFVNDDARRWFAEEAGAALVELGYERSTDW